jgi:hypothetical protein
MALVASAQEKKPSSNGQSLIVRIALAKQLPRGVTRTPQLNAIISQLRSAKKTAALASWKGFIKSNQSPGGEKLNLHRVVLWILRKAYVEPNNDLVAAADRVQYFDELTKAMRKEIASARRDLANVKSRPFTRRMVEFRNAYVAGLEPVGKAQTRPINQADLQTYLRELTSQLNAAAEDQRTVTLSLMSSFNEQQQADPAHGGFNSGRDTIKEAYTVLEGYASSRQNALSKLLGS